MEPRRRSEAGQRVAGAGMVLLAATVAAGQPFAGLCGASAQDCQNRAPALEFLGSSNDLHVIGLGDSRFKHFDEFVPAADGWIHEVCWRTGVSSLGCGLLMPNPEDPDCGCDPRFDPNCRSTLENGFCSSVFDPAPHDASIGGLWQLTIWSDFAGLPDEIVGGPFRSDFGEPGAVDPATGVPIAGGLSVVQVLSNESIGATSLLTEFVLSATFAPGQAPFVLGGACYWIEFDFTPANQFCEFRVLSSFESAPDGSGGVVGIGNRRSIIWDASATASPEVPRDHLNLDFPYCLTIEDSPDAGLGDPVGLLPTSTSQSCGAREVVVGDRVDDRIILAPPLTTVQFENTWASFDDSFPVSACQPFINSLDKPLPIGDVWFEFTTTAPDSADPTVASVLLRRTDFDPMNPQFRPDELTMQVFRLVGGQGAPEVVTPSDVEEIACTVDLELCVLDLSLNETFLVRVYSNKPSLQGAYTLELQSPCPGRENDFCTTATEIPHDPGGSGYGAPGGAVVFGDTTNATVDIGNPGGCDEPFEPAFDLPGFEDPIPHLGPGVWYRFTGMGSLVRVSTDLPETSFDTTIAAYCSDNLNDPCSSPACIAGHRDIDDLFQRNLNSEVEICAELGRDYFVLVTGFFSSGPFGLLVEELRDEFDQTISCVSTSDCVFECIFEIPPGAIDELTDLGALSEACDETNIDGNNDGCSGPPNAEGNWQGLIPKIQVGDVVTGTLWTGDGNLDTDQFLFEGMPTDGSPAIVDFSWGAESPIEILPHAGFSSWFICFQYGFGQMRRSTNFCGNSGASRQIHNALGSQDNDGRRNQNTGPKEPGYKASMGFRIRSRIPTTQSGLPCGTFNRYWFRLDDVIAWDQCEPVPDPLGDPTRDSPSNRLMGDVVFGDWDDEAIQPTFDSTCGSSCDRDPYQGDPLVCDGEGYYQDVYAGEPCDLWWPTGSLCDGERRVFGCSFNYSQAVEGDFLLLRPGFPLVGQLQGITSNPEPRFDIDWYMFEIPERSIVRIRIDSGAPMSAKLLENRCFGFPDYEQPLLFAVAATTGTCGTRNLMTDDLVTLDAGKYIVLVRWEDLYSNGGAIMFPTLVRCAQESLGKYVVEVSTEIAPQCAGDADGNGVVDFGDVISVLGNWGADYNPIPGTGIGDANDDGVVDFGDVNGVLGNWLAVCP